MNADALEFLQLSQQGLEDDLRVWGECFLYNGLSYKGVINTAELSTDLREGGLEEVLRTTIVVSRKHLTTAPVAGQTLYIGSQKARIERVGKDEISWELTCVTATH